MSNRSESAKQLPAAPVGEDEESHAFLAYPASTLSPRIVPNDMTTFKTRGISKVQKDAAQQLTELRDKYKQVVDGFNWNKLVYESEFGFEPVVGETYHLYRDGGLALRLSIIGPGEWEKKFVATLRMNFGGQWEVMDVAPDFNLNQHIALLEAERQEADALQDRVL